jgi:hypothetical protein
LRMHVMESHSVLFPGCGAQAHLKIVSQVCVDRVTMFHG